MDKLDESSYPYKKLSETHPGLEPFYYVYVKGDKENKARMDFYDKNLKKVATHDCGYYG